MHEMHLVSFIPFLSIEKLLLVSTNKLINFLLKVFSYYYNSRKFVRITISTSFILHIINIKTKFTYLKETKYKCILHKYKKAPYHLLID